MHIFANFTFFQNSDAVRGCLQDFLRFRNVSGPFTAHQQGTGAGRSDPRFADLGDAETYGNRHTAQMHTDQGLTDIETGIRPDRQNRHRVIKPFPGSSGREPPALIRGTTQTIS